MARNNGEHRCICPFCGETYILTNWMKRHMNGRRAPDGRLLNDTHKIACFEGRPTNASEKAAWRERLEESVEVPEVSE